MCRCTFVDSGIARIVDQLVNPRINTILVPKVEDIVYKYIGIRRPDEDSIGENKESKLEVPDRGSFDDVSYQKETSSNKPDAQFTSDKNTPAPVIKIENSAESSNATSATIRKEELLKRSPKNFTNEQKNDENSVDFSTYLFKSTNSVLITLGI